MKAIDEARLEGDLGYRFDYLREFIGFGDDDVAAIRSIIAQLGPRIPQIVEATYEKLLSYDATARHFVPRQAGYDGPTPENMEALSASDPQIQFRKEHLQRYLMNLLGHSYNEKMAHYLDTVGKMHTPKMGNEEIDVPLVQMNALMGLVSDILWDTIASLDLDRDAMMRVGRAFNKLLWMQNDFIVRHYAAEAPTVSRAAS